MALLRTARLFAKYHAGTQGEDDDVRAVVPLYECPPGSRAIMRAMDVYSNALTLALNVYLIPVDSPDDLCVILSGKTADETDIYYWRGHLVMNPGDVLQMNTQGTTTATGSGALMPIQSEPND